MKQRNRKKIGVRVMRKLLKSWRYEYSPMFVYLKRHGLLITLNAKPHLPGGPLIYNPMMEGKCSKES